MELIHRIPIGCRNLQSQFLAASHLRISLKIQEDESLRKYLHLAATILSWCSGLKSPASGQSRSHWMLKCQKLQVMSRLLVRLFSEKLQIWYPEISGNWHLLISGPGKIVNSSEKLVLEEKKYDSACLYEAPLCRTQRPHDGLIKTNDPGDRS